MQNNIIYALFRKFINKETSRATSAEDNLNSKIETETSRATEMENDTNLRLNTLIGSDRNSSVREITVSELVHQLIPENAKASLDTLKEIAAWIQQHPDDVAAINSDISAQQIKNNQQDIEIANIKNQYAKITDLPSTLPANGGNADTVDSYHIVISNTVPTIDDKKILTFIIS